MSHKRFGSFMKRWRETSHLSQSDLAKRSGLSRQMISMIENGKVVPSLDTMSKLQDVLGFSMNLVLVWWRLSEEEPLMYEI